MNIPFIGPTYNSRSSNIDASRSVNFYPETNPIDAKSVIALINTPGTALWAQVGPSPVRGMHVLGNLLYVVAGGKLYAVDGAGVVSAALGTLTTSAGLVAVSDNGLAVSGVGGNQLMIVDGVCGYVYNASTGAFSAVSGGGWPTSGAGTLTYIDGYFVIGNANSMSASASNLYDGTTWNALATSPGQRRPRSDPGSDERAPAALGHKTVYLGGLVRRRASHEPGVSFQQDIGRGLRLRDARARVRRRGATTRFSSSPTSGTMTAGNSSASWKCPGTRHRS